MQQMPVDKYQRVVFIICHPIVIGKIFVYFQSQAILVIVKTVLFLLVLGEIVGCPVSVCILQVCLLLVRLDVALQLHLLHPLHHIQVYPRTKVHPQAQPACYIVILLPILHGIAAVVHQLQTEGIHRGGIGRQLLTHRQLSRVIRQVCRAAVAYPIGLVCIIRLYAVGALIAHHEIYVVTGEPRPAFVAGRCVGGQRQTVIATLICIPLLRCRCDIP